MDPPVARAEGVVKRFGEGEAALDGVAISIASGGITGLVGPDGAGKTTLIRILAGLMKPSGGTVEVLAERPATTASRSATCPSASACTRI